MTTVTLCLVTFSAAVASLWVLERCAPRLGLIDHPAGHKQHRLATPVVGGLAITTVLLPVWVAQEMAVVSSWLLAGVAGSLILGVIDDVRHLSVRVKLMSMLAIFTVTLAGSGTFLQHLGELWPELEVSTGVLAYPLTLFAAVGVINAFNLIDGSDGLAGTVAIIAFGAFLLVARLSEQGEWEPFLLTLVAATTAFLLFNLRFGSRARARLFLGDGGSLVIGFVLFWLSVRLSQGAVGAPPMVMTWLLALPMLDTVATMILRMREGKSAFSPGHDHFHHLLRAHGFSVKRVTVVAALICAGSSALGIAMWQAGVPDWISLLAFLGVTVGYVRLHLSGWSRLGRCVRSVGTYSKVKAGLPAKN